MSSSTTLIEVKNLTKTFGTHTVVDQLNMTIEPGQLYAFLGPNGAGKSTTMKMLTGYLAPSEGTGWIAGHNMATERLAGAERLGYLPENGPLYPDMTPHGLLEFFADARGLVGDEKKSRIDQAVDLCYLGSVLHKPISKLSKGFRQRVGMAQALLHEPDVLILDEPTAGLDPLASEILKEKVLAEKMKGKLVLVTSHILSDLEELTTDVMYIIEGKLQFYQSIAQLKARTGEDKLNRALAQVMKQNAEA